MPNAHINANDASFEHAQVVAKRSNKLWQNDTEHEDIALIGWHWRVHDKIDQKG